ncbi:flavodoxin family protein [Kribbella kalugense]|uniref:NAD(P)H dehydrogenase (Quinone) n=1 Tax=Kribbella kalugense TaxID=2512221 RepID=A0A4R8A183_9ACTN|nr:NAD(P)H-dependent oxidoreductase [Kribbella kalugense]TDW24269.1 NAD(P)H dehydrogenase (quinone) [Kribbella kalugense]
MSDASTRLAIIYYSATGNVHALAKRAAHTGEKIGAEVRLRRAAEIASESAIASNPAWFDHLVDTRDVPAAVPDDMEWADAVLFGTPTRFGNVSAQLKQFIDQLGGLWSEGRLADKAYAGFVSASTRHGGQETTLLALYNSVHHFGGVLVPPGYTNPSVVNPYGVSHVSNDGAPRDEHFASMDHLVERLVRFAQLIRSARASVR